MHTIWGHCGIPIPVHSTLENVISPPRHQTKSLLRRRSETCDAGRAGSAASIHIQSTWCSQECPCARRVLSTLSTLWLPTWTRAQSAASTTNPSPSTRVPQRATTAETRARRGGKSAATRPRRRIVAARRRTSSSTPKFSRLLPPRVRQNSTRRFHDNCTVWYSFDRRVPTSENGAAGGAPIPTESTRATWHPRRCCGRHVSRRHARGAPRDYTTGGVGCSHVMHIFLVPTRRR